MSRRDRALPGMRHSRVDQQSAADAARILMTHDEQLRRWVAGDPMHNPDRDECCPDFSCCKPELLAPEAVRQKFAAASEEEQHGMLMHFLGAGVAAFAPEKKVRIAGQGEPQ